MNLESSSALGISDAWAQPCFLRHSLLQLFSSKGIFLDPNLHLARGTEFLFFILPFAIVPLAAVTSLIWVWNFWNMSDLCSFRGGGMLDLFFKTLMYLLEVKLGFRYASMFQSWYYKFNEVSDVCWYLLYLLIVDFFLNMQLNLWFYVTHCAFACLFTLKTFTWTDLCTIQSLIILIL